MTWRDDAGFVTALQLADTFDTEGGYVDDPDDPGGATNHGISLRFLRGLGDPELDLDGDGDLDADDVRALTRDDAAELIYAHFWQGYRYADLPTEIGAKVFDLGVNMGPRPIGRCLQRAVRAVHGPRLVEDGVIGPKTLRAVDQVYGPALLPALRSEAAGYYRVLIARDPTREKYQEGWLTRAYA